MSDEMKAWKYWTASNLQAIVKLRQALARANALRASTGGADETD